ncbi:DEDDy 3'-5' exonuclease domain protein [Metarhizium robertsii]|uniref:Exonuclease n=2 Tax=Metarhizium robertsii TaxID=568076 RepID=E9ER89_METRA|nr:exonuclease [Metarhizium robertsii ARSEF 23]EFZ01902.1 exonuclease [Metarhizium robertsii ARSEF 23]EXV02399.1 DEDDy 3'-5' exonuclease domain protein [Metarhizium robertsii]
MSFSLRHIPCPAGKNCTAFQCIFGHGEEDATEAKVEPTPPSSSRDASSSISRDRSPPYQEAPRKRIKVEQKNDSAPSQPPSKASSLHDNASKHHTLSTKPRSATRSVSPPPLQRNTRTADTKARSSSSTPQKTAATKDSKSPVPSGKPVTKADCESTKRRKPESLNPRLLKSSPASHETRLKLLKMLHHEYARLNRALEMASMKAGEPSLVLSPQGLIFRALDEEEATALEKPAVYTNVMKNKIMQHKKMNVAQWKELRVKEAPRPKEQHGGNIPKEINTGLTAAQEVELLKRIVTRVDDLSKHGYVSSVPAEDVVESARAGQEAGKGWEKCDRCQQRFQVFPGRRAEDGALVSGGACNFHWGKTYVPEKAPGDTARVPKRYRCCGQEVGDSAGCATHDKHVFKAGDPKRLAAVLNYASTPENPGIPEDRAVCFDCEMGYTVHGMELIRLTATSWPLGEELLDVLVQPIGEILDLNSRYSGVWPDDLANAKPWVPDDAAPPKSGPQTGTANESNSKDLKIVSSPEVARDLLFSLISPSTPLIGHGLENDLNAVRIVHPTLIDTVLLYPHKLGLPYRHGLKMLMDVHLNKKIQQDTGPKVLGHDSAEDARAAGELVRLKVMNEWKDMQRAGWTLVGGHFWPPGKPGGLTEAFIEK